MCGGEVAALGGGGQVGAVVDDDLVEEVSGVGGVVGVGDDEELVALAAAVAPTYSPRLVVAASTSW